MPFVICQKNRLSAAVAGRLQRTEFLVLRHCASTAHEPLNNNHSFSLRRGHLSFDVEKSLLESSLDSLGESSIENSYAKSRKYLLIARKRRMTMDIPCRKLSKPQLQYSFIREQALSYTWEQDLRISSVSGSSAWEDILRNANKHNDLLNVCQLKQLADSASRRFHTNSFTIFFDLQPTLRLHRELVEAQVVLRTSLKTERDKKSWLHLCPFRKVIRPVPAERERMRFSPERFAFSQENLIPKDMQFRHRIKGDEMRETWDISILPFRKMRRKGTFKDLERFAQNQERAIAKFLAGVRTCRQGLFTKLRNVTM